MHFSQASVVAFIAYGGLASAHYQSRRSIHERDAVADAEIREFAKREALSDYLYTRGMQARQQSDGTTPPGPPGAPGASGQLGPSDASGPSGPLGAGGAGGLGGAGGAGGLGAGGAGGAGGNGMDPLGSPPPADAGSTKQLPACKKHGVIKVAPDQWVNKGDRSPCKPSDKQRKRAAKAYTKAHGASPMGNTGGGLPPLDGTAAGVPPTSPGGKLRRRSADYNDDIYARDLYTRDLWARDAYAEADAYDDIYARDIYAREAYAEADPYEELYARDIYARDADAEAEHEDIYARDLYARDAYADPDYDLYARDADADNYGQW